jgi:hypothetical protein
MKEGNSNARIEPNFGTEMHTVHNVILLSKSPMLYWQTTLTTATNSTCSVTAEGRQWAVASITLLKSVAWEWLHRLPQWAPQPAAQVRVGRHCDAPCNVVIRLPLRQNCCQKQWCPHCCFRQAEYLVPLFGTSPPRNRGTRSCAVHVSVKVFPLAPVQEHISGNSQSPSSTCKWIKQVAPCEVFLTITMHHIKGPATWQHYQYANVQNMDFTSCHRNI